ncbi:hypothetical protein A2641_02740 [Candidatus Nomurabacteria bacterium RIFCSPHIGHO2_01_FULL_37_25]|uniref:Metal-dependent hydrolase n=1 Tax=Candidatus Nomurabacteria bacterium RIFCSPLOWO2_01_FULL_36_16 TaxID=1801767 RepID=A0A1F6X0A4_9BACT|nr:MAG: hypothetical protein A2641_02740 [Candidatus Nomurabacteria bacterium RIFCSPHIGHO2_01_FULL_37_25]OGI75068.1 MAG: hypothetical protein A3D36_03485 [Candidatus Nomurabacteria bacterium RIFCSPHIGHO2_02_FULL_36_29]OGI87579.1 MAG: hypothetical protein A3A91_01555 [Candidatus Nomurabacteria bacterium RIFCSPLOWO2_01_FULL_36_16]OGI96472.1 MAG: hypothetical protein A3I84_02895 [Candidatus Nomurabacteria bacterium RIFCSPLOWO2_02_FULL_36_8]
MKKLSKKLVTHDGSFQSDDIFAAATLAIFLEKAGETFEIIRTRNPEIINTGDYVFDVGGIYDEAINRFDHHQIGGAGKGLDNIDYAAFGLVWKKFGKIVAGSEKVAGLINKRLVTPIDAWDNGFDLVLNKYNVTPYYVQHFFLSMVPTWREENITNDEMFLKSVEIAKEILLREIIHAQDLLLADEKVLSIYNNTKDKRIIILDKNYPYEYTLTNFSEPLFVIYPRINDNLWGVKAVRKNPKSFSNRKDFPKSWAGLRDDELQKTSGVSDAVFCHRGLFMAVAKSKEGAMKLAQIAVKS